MIFSYDIEKKIFINENGDKHFTNIYGNLELIFFRKVSYETVKRLDHGINFFTEMTETRSSTIFVFDLKRIPGKN